MSDSLPLAALGYREYSLLTVNAPLPLRLFSQAALLLLVSACCVNAQVLPLDFANGNGTSSVDQYTGVAGSGWKTAWTTGAGAGTTSYLGTVTNTNPLAGGGNYLNMNFTVAGTETNQWVRLSRQLDLNTISLSSPVMYSFTLRPDSTIANASETFTIFSGTSATNNTGAGDTWKITADGGGWSAYNNNTIVVLGKVGATVLKDTVYQFNIISDPLTKTWSLTINNLTNNQSVSSGTLNWRSTAAVENSFLNFNAQSGSKIAGETFGYSLDNIVVIPEPGTVALVTVAGIASLFARWRRTA